MTKCWKCISDDECKLLEEMYTKGISDWGRTVTVLKRKDIRYNSDVYSTLVVSGGNGETKWKWSVLSTLKMVLSALFRSLRRGYKC